MEERYTPENIEKKWQKIWEEQNIFRQYTRTKKFYTLDMFPYPSGAGLHVGHPKGYIATDVLARMKQLQGYGVLHPMGWDAFGLPAEQFALKNKTHPKIATEENIQTNKRQLASIGFTYDWEREINTTDPDYYKWTQWIFLKMWQKGLAYESHEPINWCPNCKTGLANEDLEQGKCERCGSEVEKRPLRQWVLRMTQYADRLLYDLDKEGLDWPEAIKEQQRNWIGRSEGAEISFPLRYHSQSHVHEQQATLPVFTTRPDTLFGATYVVLAPEHPWVTLALQDDYEVLENTKEVRAYVEAAKKKSEIERAAVTKEKTGVLLKGVVALNPATQQEIPLYVADYVFAGYGTGAIMAVPAHDERDFEFAKKFNLAVIPVIENDFDGSAATLTLGTLINSGEFNGLSSEAAKEKITEAVGGRMVTSYRMRDWTFSRQRYWGEPIPLIHCEQCGVVGVPEEELPVRLPEADSYEPNDSGESPLANITEWVNVTCPVCGGSGKRETNTMPQWAGSCWYYLRYIDPQNKTVLVDADKERSMMPVDVYVGGAEHATRHLLYARFWHKFLFDQGVVSIEEPFTKLVNVGLILASDGRKMSKRWGNVVNPDDMVREFGADAFRLYEMFMGPFTQSVAWNTDGLSGTRRFLEKVWKAAHRVQAESKNPTFESLLQESIKKITEDITEFRFNTAVSQLMIVANAFPESIAKDAFERFLVLLAPFAPHITEELWQALGNEQSIFLTSWPEYDASKVVQQTLTMAVQVNGKMRGLISVNPEMNEEEIKQLALAEEKVQAAIDGKEVQKIIVVPRKIVSIVL